MNISIKQIRRWWHLIDIKERRHEVAKKVYNNRESHTKRNILPAFNNFQICECPDIKKQNVTVNIKTENPVGLQHYVCAHVLGVRKTIIETDKCN